MKKITFLASLLALSLGANATFNTVTVTGYNRDIISNGSVAALSSISPSMPQGFDSAGYALVAQDYNFDGYTPSYYLPTGGALSSGLTSTLTYQLADYSSNNALRLVNSGDFGTLTLTTPQVAGALYLLGTSGSGDSYTSITVNFTDGSSQIFSSIIYPDWYSSGGSVNGIGRVSVTDNHTEGSSDAPALFENVLNIDPANYTKLVASITVQKTSSTGILAIMAVSASDICSGTPTAGTVSATVSSGCSEYNSTLSLTGGTTSSGITYQWQSSADGTTWTNVTGATSATYNADVTGNVYYRAYVVCSVSSLADTSASTELTLTAPSPVIASLPFYESFENWIAACYTYDRPGVNWLTNPATGNNSWRRDDQGDDASWTFSTGYMYSPAYTAGAHSARFHSGYSDLEGDMNLHIDLSPAGTKQISFDYTNTSGSDYLIVELSEDGGTTFTGLDTINTTSGWATEVMTTTSVAANAIIRLAAFGDYGSTDIGVDNLSIVLLTPCSGTPAPGTITASQSTGCSEFTANLSLPIGSTSGLTYQWQSSTDGTTWTDVAGATTIAYSADVTSNIYYRINETCTASSSTGSSASIYLQIITPVATTATVPFFEGFESWIGSCFSYDRPGNNWLTAPATGNNSWRRDDQGTDASWTFPTDYMYSPASTEGDHSARFHSGYSLSGEEGDLDLHIDLSTAGLKLINFDYNNEDGVDYMTVQLSEDGGTTFTTLATYNTTPSGWVSEMVSTSSTSANAIIRFSAISDYGGTDIGIDSLSITIAPSCAGAPVAGTFTASQTSGCVAYTSNLSVDAPLSLTGISYQWQTSTDGVTYTNVAGATSTTYAASISSSVYYRFYVVCSISGLADTSAATAFNYAPVVPVYATVPYFQGFESWIGGCHNYDRPDASSETNPSYGDNSWRRDDQGADAGWDYPTDYMYSPASVEGSHSARFHSGYTSYGTEGDVDFYVDLSAAGTKLITFDYNNQDGDDYINVELSEDGGTTFTTLGTFTTTSAWASEIVTTTSTAANAIIRFAGIADYGGSDIGLDSLAITIAPSCSGTPTAGAFSASATSGCSTYTSTLTIAAPDYLTGLSYQWQSSADGVTYTDIPGATAITYTATVTSNVYYRFEAICSVSGITSTSAATELTLAPEVATPATLPYFQGFENWIGGCYSYDRPDAAWILTPTYGNDSWRRDDQGDDAAWDYTPGGAYFPTSTEASHSARFHSYEAGSGDIGEMDLYVNLSTPGTKNISFDYINTDGSDNLTVSLSEDGGVTFTTLGTYNTTSAWETETLSTTSTAASAIIRFTATSDFGVTDIGIDSLFISGPAPAPCGMPTDLAASAITDSSATLSWTAVSGAAYYEYVIDNSSSTPTGTPITISTTSLVVVGFACNTTYYLHVLTVCTADSSSWVTIPFTTDTCSNLQVGTIGANSFGVDAYPNPTTGIVAIEIKGAISGSAELRLTDVTGKILQVVQVDSKKVTMDISQLASGIYFISYSDNINKRTIKLNKL